MPSDVVLSSKDGETEEWTQRRDIRKPICVCFNMRQELGLAQATAPFNFKYTHRSDSLSHQSPHWNKQQNNPPMVNKVRSLNSWTEAWGLHGHQSERWHQAILRLGDGFHPVVHVYFLLLYTTRSQENTSDSIFKTFTCSSNITPWPWTGTF